MEFFRRYLQATYKSLDALNASWDTKYGSWDEIDERAAKITFATQSGHNAAPWADWHAASEQATHRFYAALDAGVRRTLPTARMGPSGTRDSSGTNGFDWWLLAHDFRSVCLYAGVHGELYRSFAPKGSLMTTWSHLTDSLIDPDELRVRLWQDVFAQCGGTPVYGGRYSNVFFPDYRPKPGLRAYTAELARVRDGFGRLILGARRNDAAVAIFYSPACYRARVVAMKDDGNNKAAAEQNGLLASISAALGDLRIGSHFVSYEQVARGELDPRTTRVFFLWGALALSDAEAAAIRRYLEGGGIVIADGEPGVYDEHCHRRAAGALHDCLPPDGSPARQVGKGRFIVYRDLGTGYVKARGYVNDGMVDPTAGDVAIRMAAKLRAMLAAQAGLQGSFRLSDDRGRDLDHMFTALDYVRRLGALFRLRLQRRLRPRATPGWLYLPPATSTTAARVSTWVRSARMRHAKSSFAIQRAISSRSCLIKCSGWTSRRRAGGAERADRRQGGDRCRRRRAVRPARYCLAASAARRPRSGRQSLDCPDRKRPRRGPIAFGLERSRGQVDPDRPRRGYGRQPRGDDRGSRRGGELILRG